MNSRTHIAISYAKYHRTHIIELPSFKCWLKQKGENNRRISSIIRILYHDARKQIQFARRISGTRFSIIELEKKLLPIKMDRRELVTVVPSITREEWDRMSSNNYEDFDLGRPSYIVCNKCGNSFDSHMVSTKFAKKHRYLETRCPHCLHLEY